MGDAPCVPPPSSEGPTRTVTESSRAAQVPWRELVRDYRRPDVRHSVFQLVSTLALFVLTWAAMIWSLQGPYALTLALAVIGGGLIVRLFGFFHDCVHESFFRSPVANRWVGRFIGILSLTPFGYWRRTHRTHHATSGNLDKRGVGDIDTLTVEEYLARTPWQQFLYRMGRNPIVFLTIGPFYLFILKHRIPFDMPWSWKKEWASVLWNNLVTAVVVVAMCRWLGTAEFFSIQFPVFFVSAATGMWLFFVQHQFPLTYWARNEKWNHASACLDGSSYLALPRVMRWFTADIGVHHIHHLCSAIPNYRLHQCMVDAGERLPDRRLGVLQSLRCGHLALWDTEQERLIRFRDLERREVPSAN